MKVEHLDSLIEVELDQIPPDVELENDLFIYLPQNSRIICLVRKGSALSKTYQSQLLSKGVKTVYITKSDEETFQNWVLKISRNKTALSKQEKEKEKSLDEASATKEALESKPESNDFSEGTPSFPKSDSDLPKGSSHPAQDLERDLQNKSPIDATRQSSSLALSPQKNDTPELPLSAEEAKRAILKSVDLVFPRLSDLVRSIFNLHGNFLTRSHGVHVALYSCLLSIAFKKAEPRTLSVLTLASLFHDVGLARLPIHSIRELKSHQELAPNEYQKHVELGADWVGDLIEGLDNEVIDVIRAHHERFDGHGYPNKKKGFELITLAQVLAMADTLDHLCTGTWNGKKHEIPEAIDAFTSLEPDIVHPRYFLPDIYTKAQTFLRSPELASSLISAEERLRKYSVF